MTTETRYIDLLGQIPRGTFYQSIGNILPYRSNNTTLRLLTNVFNTNFLILVNGIQSGITTTDSNGEALFEVFLPLGDVVVELQQQFSEDKIVSYITTRDYSVWYAGYAEQLERIDDHIEATLNSYYLDSAGSTDIDLAHGVRLLTPNEFNASLESYREILQFMRQSFRQFAGRLSGKRAVVAAITQVNPLIFNRNINTPRWILGYQRLPNGDFQEANRPLDGSDLSTQINLVGQFVTLLHGDSYVNTGTGTLSYQKNFGRFKWVPPNIADYVPTLIDPRFYDSPNINSDGDYTINSGRALAFIESYYPTASPTQYTLDPESRLYLNIDNKGQFEVHIDPAGAGSPASTTPELIVDAINTMLHSSNLYEDYRKVLSQPAGSLADYVEVINVSNGTQLGTSTNPPSTQDTATIDTDGAGIAMAYTAPQDAQGAFTTLNLGDLTRLVSDNGIDYIDVFVSKNTLPFSASDIFDIEKRYIDIASTISSDKKIRIESQNEYDIDGDSVISVLDGPYSQARNIFGLDQQFANLSATALAGATQVTVPAGTMEIFSSVNGTINLPFPVLIGRGEGPTLTSRDINVTNPLDPTATIDNIVGATLNEGHTHVKIESTDTPRTYINTGIHPIINIDIANNEMQIAYNGPGASAPSISLGSSTTLPGVVPVRVDPSLPEIVSLSQGINIRYTDSAQTLEWRLGSTASYGPAVSVGSGGYFRLYNDTSITSAKWIDVLVDVGSLPGTDETNFMSVGYGFFGFGSDDTTLWSSGEKAIVTEVTPSGGDEIWTLQEPLIGEYDIAVGSYEVLPYNRQPPLDLYGEESFGNLDISVDVSEEPININTQANIVVGDPELPTGWLDISASSQEFVITPEAKYNKGSLLINDDANEIIIERDVPYDENSCGFTFTFKAWVRNTALSRGHFIEFNLEFDFGSGPIVSSNFSVGNDETVQYPKLIEFSQIFPVDATQFKVRIRRTIGGTGAEAAIIEKAVILKDSFDSLFLGDGTIPRSGGRSYFGSLFYVWSPDELQSNEIDVLGISAPSLDGLIRDSHNAHEQIDAFDVTDVVSGNVVNVRGAVNDNDWLASNLINLETVIRNPDRFSYVKPIHPSLVEEEELTNISQVAPHTATLVFMSDQNKNNTILYEDGVPVPNNQWVFNNSTEIEIISGFVAGVVYTIEYNRLTQAETTPIDLDSPSNNGNDTWFSDILIWNRHLSNISVLKESVSLVFNAAFNAVLPVRSDRNKLKSTLIERTGTTERVIPQSSWRYVDSLTVNINGNQFNANAIYSLEYNQRITDPSRVIGYTFEIKSANSVFSLASASYINTSINGCIDLSKRFHQLRASFENITDVRDLRLHSMVLKGINMLGSGSPPPGF